MAPARVRGCAGQALGAVAAAAGLSGKPMPAAGETAHVRRLLVDRSRCGLEVSPAPPGIQTSPRPGRRAVVAMEGREPLSRRMWGRRPGRPGECYSALSDAEGGSEMDIIFKGRRTSVPERFRRHASAKLAKLEKLDHNAIRIDVEVSTERNPRQADRSERVELTISRAGPAIRAEAAADDRYAALDLAFTKLEGAAAEGGRAAQGPPRRPDRAVHRRAGGGGRARPERRDAAADAAALADVDIPADPRARRRGRAQRHAGRAEGQRPTSSWGNGRRRGETVVPLPSMPEDDIQGGLTTGTSSASATRPRPRRPSPACSRSRWRATARWSCGRSSTPRSR